MQFLEDFSAFTPPKVTILVAIKGGGIDVQDENGHNGEERSSKCKKFPNAFYSTCPYQGHYHLKYVHKLKSANGVI